MSKYAATPGTYLSAVGYPSSTNSEPGFPWRPFNGTFTTSHPGWQFASSSIGCSPVPEFPKAVPDNTAKGF